MPTNWIDRFVEEKGLDRDELFEVQGAWGLNFISLDIVVEAIKQTSRAELVAIKRQLGRIDFVNGNVRHYFRHLAQALAI